MDFPATDILDGIILIKVPKTIKNGPRKSEFIETIQAVEVVPILVPSRIKILSRNVIIPELTKVTVREDTKVLDCTIAVSIPPKAKPPKGIFVIFPIHFDSLSVPMFSISLLKLCNPKTNKEMDAIIMITA